MKTYKCPVLGCGKEFTSAERQGKNCPCGKVEIQLKQVRQEGKTTLEWIAVLADGAVAPTLNSNKPPTIEQILSEAYGMLCSEPGSNPLVFLKALKDRPSYTVVHVGRILIGPLYCPNPRCGKYMFTNTTLRSGFVNQEHQCDHSNCKAQVTFIFTSNLVDIARMILPEQITT